MKALRFHGIAVLSGLLIGVLVGWHYGRAITDGQLIWEEMLAGAEYGRPPSYNTIRPMLNTPATPL